MRYDQNSALKEVLRRRDVLLVTRTKKLIRNLSAATVSLAVMLVISVVNFTAIVNPGTGLSVYGAFLLSAEAGGYVLIGVLAFILGVLFTLLCIQSRKLKSQKELMNNKNETEAR